tara:strand:+ start:139 stop:339 length:201 start_codon:yes stop_codon:yes gene_type:complete
MKGIVCIFCGLSLDLVSLANNMVLTRYHLRKERKMKYNYDHIISILLKKAGWIRVPLFLPRGQDGK